MVVGAVGVGVHITTYLLLWLVVIMTWAVFLIGGNFGGEFCRSGCCGGGGSRGVWPTCYCD